MVTLVEKVAGSISKRNMAYTTDTTFLDLLQTHNHQFSKSKERMHAGYALTPLVEEVENLLDESVREFGGQQCPFNSSDTATFSWS